jgi:hypothetical protein
MIEYDEGWGRRSCANCGALMYLPSPKRRKIPLRAPQQRSFRQILVHSPLRLICHLELCRSSDEMCMTASSLAKAAVGVNHEVHNQFLWNKF